MCSTAVFSEMSATKSSWIRRLSEVGSSDFHGFRPKSGISAITRPLTETYSVFASVRTSSRNINHKILCWLFKTDRKHRSHVVKSCDQDLLLRHFRFLAVAQNWNCMTKNFPRFLANTEGLYILFLYLFVKFAVLGIEYPFKGLSKPVGRWLQQYAAYDLFSSPTQYLDHTKCDQRMLLIHKNKMD